MVALRFPPWSGLLCGTVCACLVLSACCALAQSTGGALVGTVLDERGAPIEQAQIRLTSPALPGLAKAISGALGRFHVDALPVGIYRASVTRVGLRELVIEGLRIELGRITDAGELRLGVAAIDVPETRVSAERADLGSRVPTSGGRISAETMRGLPGERDYQSMVTLFPHASASTFGDRANLAGTSGPESNYFVDGANVVEPPGNALSTSLPHNFVREIEVKAGGYAAEFGGAGGGVVNAVTASGGNDFSGQVFGFYGSRLFTSSSGGSAVSPHTSDYASWDAGLSVGGAFVRDRLWYFLAYDPTIERQQVDVPGIGGQTDARESHRFAAKLTARPDERTQLVLSAVGDPGTRDQVGGVLPAGVVTLNNVDPALGTLDDGGGTVALQGTRTLGSSAVMVLGGNLFSSRYVFGARSERGASEPLYVSNVTGAAEGGFGSATDRHADRASLHGSVTWSMQRHLLKAGASYDDESFHELLAIEQITQLNAATWRFDSLGGRDSRNHIRTPVLYLQDAWQPTRALSIEAGLRWTEEYWMASGGSVGQRIPGQWQPRLGAHWSMGNDRRTAWFASAGRFAQRTRLNVPGFFLQDSPSTYLVRIYGHDPRSDASGGFPFFAQSFGHQPAVDGLRGAEFDEYQVGGERLIGAGVKLRVSGMIRSQRSGVVGVVSPISGQAVYGNPGFGELDVYPHIERTYRAIEFSADGRGRAGAWGASYVYSSLRGNYEGYWDQTGRTNDPLGGGSFITEPGAVANTRGQLPADRPHQLKAFGSLPLRWGFSGGATALWASGTPISELGSIYPLPAPYFKFLSPRGGLGRTPAVYDLDLRVAWEPKERHDARASLRLVMDIDHVGNPRRTVVVDELHYLAATPAGQQVNPNPHYGQPLLLQPPVAYRFGVEVNW